MKTLIPNLIPFPVRAIRNVIVFPRMTPAQGRMKHSRTQETPTMKPNPKHQQP